MMGGRGHGGAREPARSDRRRRERRLPAASALRLRTLVREPLLHFLILGALLFAAYGWLNRGALPAPTEIVVDAARVASLSAQFQTVWQRPPTAAELDGLIQSFVREEIYYREGLALGLEREDPIVRRRIAQKLAFVADGLAPEAPSDAELQGWLDAHAADYALAPRYTLRQVFFDPARHTRSLAADLAAARAGLAQGRDGFGDATLLPPALADASPAEIARTFGSEFAAALEGLPTGAWQGPVRSGYGEHLVIVDAFVPARAPALDEVRAQVERDFVRKRGEQLAEAFYQKLRAHYTVRIEAGPAAQEAPR